MISRVFGWSPPDNAEYIDVPLHIQPFHGPKNTRKSNQVSSATAAAGTVGLNTSTSPSSTLEPAEQGSCAGLDLASPGDNKHTDPIWVARPCNEFILFRCDYVRKHSHDGKRETEKSLSKEAAEAWHHLSKEERLYWKECATGERIEHAKRYPNYRYRPKKNAMMRRRQAHSSMNTSSKAKSSCDTITRIIANPHPQSRSSINRNPPKHMLSVLKPTPSRSSYVPRSSIGDSSDKSSRSTSTLCTPETSSSPNIGSLYNQYNPTSTIPLPSCSQNPFNTPDLNNFLSQTDPSTPTSSVGSSFSNWNGGNIVHPFGSDPSSDVSMSGLSQNSLSSLDLAELEMVDNIGTNQSRVMHQCTTGETQFTPPPSDSLHHLEQQQLFNNGLYQPTENFWISYPAMDSASMQMAQIASPADSFNPVRTHAQHTIRYSARCAATSASSTPSIPNNFYETMAFAGVGGASNFGPEQLYAMGFR